MPQREKLIEKEFNKAELNDSPERLRFTTGDKKLPPNFAERVLELEMELESDCSSIDSINNLLYLYSVSSNLFLQIICLIKINYKASRRVLQWHE